MPENELTINKILENLNVQSFDTFDVKGSINLIQKIAGKIPVNGEYDPSIIGARIGEYIVAIQECGKVLATLGLVAKFQETETDKEFAMAALDRALQKGFKTDGKAKLYAQMDEKYIEAKNKLNEILAVIDYIENWRTSLDKAHLHCKKILDRNSVEEKFAKDFERFPIAEQEISWINDKDLK